MVKPVRADTVPALPDTLPVTLPVRFPSNVPATNLSEPIAHSSSDSSQISVLAAELPLVILIPVSSDVVPEVKLLFNAIILSARLIVSELTVVVDPETVKSPEIVIESLIATTPDPFALNVKLVFALADSIAFTSIEFVKVIGLPSDEVTLEPA